MSSAVPLVIEHLSRRFGEREVVREFSLAGGPGDRIALHGPNGSGKTTILRCIAGTLTPSNGTVAVLGHPAGTLAARSHIGVSLSQERSFYLRLSGRANLEFYARLRGLDKRAATREVRRLEEELELTAILDTRVDRCSTGMVQQLAFARALLGDPALLLLDEPTRSLDEAAVERLWLALDRRPATALLIATHSPGDVQRCTDVREL